MALKNTERNCCPTCGQTLPPQWPFENLTLGIKEKMLLGRVLKAGREGIRTDLLFNYMYDNDASGGPESYLRVINVTVAHINEKIKPLGYRIMGRKAGNQTPGEYRLVNIAEAQNGSKRQLT